MRARFLAVLIAGGVAAFACGGDGDSRSYPVDLDDEDYDLAAMQVTESDMEVIEPVDGLQLVLSDGFTNAEWAGAFASQNPETDPAAKETQVEAQGRIDGHFAVFAWETPLEHLGRTQEVQSHTTLYSDTESASAAIAQHACGVFIGDDRPLDPLEVPQLADESAAFAHEQTRDPLGIFVDTVVCFRTGRVVHAVVQNGLDGTQDLEATLELARRKLAYTNAAFDGEDPPQFEDGDAS